MNNNTEAKEALAKARAIVLACNAGALPYDRAKALCKPYLNIFNSSAKKLAVKYKQNYKPTTFASLRR